MGEEEKLDQDTKKSLVSKFIGFILGFRSCCSKKHHLGDYPIIRLVNLILQDAIKKGASEIHFEPLEKSLDVRYKIDGIVHIVMQPPFRLKNAMIERIKIMANLKITKQKIPQQSLLILDAQETGRQNCFETSITQTEFGEKAVLILQQ